MNAGSYDISPKSSSDALIWRRSAARTVSVLNRQLVALAGPVIDDGERVLRHLRVSWMVVAEKDNYLGDPWLSPVPVFIPRARAPDLCWDNNSPVAAINRAFCSALRRKVSRIAAHAAKAMGAQFDVIVASFIKLGANLAPIGAMAESAPAEMDPDFLPGMNLLEKLQAAIDESRARVKQDLVLYSTQTPREEARGTDGGHRRRADRVSVEGASRGEGRRGVRGARSGDRDAGGRATGRGPDSRPSVSAGMSECGDGARRASFSLWRCGSGRP